MAFCRDALRIMENDVFPGDSVSFELVVAGTKAIVATLVFFDTFDGNAADFVKPSEKLATDLKLPLLAESRWASWYEAAAALWPVINEMNGDPLVMLQHSVGTKAVPDEQILDFVSDTIVADAPLDEPQLSIVEIRTLGVTALSSKKVPSGNCHHQFFVDLVAMYDAKNKTFAERQAIADKVQCIVEKAKVVDGLVVDFSGTHSQPDDPDPAVKASVIFGSEEMAEAVRKVKKELDPDNRFRFHPFTKIL
ncbi:MAG: FAD-binding oxidoreductase [Planctomycetaceae bacterium]|nr:FAD-binding oxidoreductase [Planctomycetaceae bacterium]